MTILAPSRARRMAVALPIPLEPPVMRATLPARGREVVVDIVVGFGFDGGFAGDESEFFGIPGS